ncbi:branched chain amino acid aminotransferase [Nitrosopumilus sp. b1]|uniref:branched-chain amino acid transaminase n=1 Tax=Nitrosopumilus sp. b1 TaxID=2109907 RepID=UPI000E2A8091|nr:branched-chain amino acid transaminase [Nitrosopumilus sp. b1]RDJ32222.1 MAG: branched-chain amino acid transaminase [Thermoproteota archaeon]KAF6243971.1 branched chain amino acid aminotransferase [Nitrosopumilus sp. b1]RDJ33285.1 MAG: branched-chain amino acid transaminase [Thermoproteota archaeon]RDJ36211.1 MAG: branched-chain amino acid transaminase [Thermoproteota archaeon]RDJ38843.1 MAG: branched-chain amino acid transaminase [Thermoproteota archaeon]
MKEIGKIWMNGKFVPFKDAKVHVLTHALHYSTSVFEGIRCYDTPKGSAIFRLPEHIDRLFKSAKLYSMKMNFSKKQISDAIIKTVKESKLKECYIRPIAYYGYGTMGLTPTQNNVDVAIACWEWKMGESKAGKFSGAKCKISSWIKIDSRAQPMKAKAASNYANAALARMEALDNGYDEAIMLNYHGKVSEGSAENIFIVKDDQIMTPPMSAGILEGITRDSVIQIIEENGGYVIETDLDREDLYAADEVFMTGTAAEVKSVTQIDKIKIGDAKPGKITKALQKTFMDVAMGKDERFLPWLKYI